MWLHLTSGIYNKLQILVTHYNMKMRRMRNVCNIFETTKTSEANSNYCSYVLSLQNRHVVRKYYLFIVFIYSLIY